MAFREVASEQSVSSEINDNPEEPENEQRQDQFNLGFWTCNDYYSYVTNNWQASVHQLEQDMADFALTKDVQQGAREHLIPSAISGHPFGPTDAQHQQQEYQLFLDYFEASRPQLEKDMANIARTKDAQQAASKSLIPRAINDHPFGPTDEERQQQQDLVNFDPNNDKFQDFSQPEDRKVVQQDMDDDDNQPKVEEDEYNIECIVCEEQLDDVNECLVSVTFI